MSPRAQPIRLAPAVTVLPLHHPIRVAEQWATLDLLSGGRVDFAAGRGYDRREYEPFNVNFDNNQSLFEEGLGINAICGSRRTHLAPRGELQFDQIAITPRPIQRPLPAYVASFRRHPSNWPDGWASGSCGSVRRGHDVGGLEQVTRTYHEACRATANNRGDLCAVIFSTSADNAPEEQAARARQIRYYKECVITAFPSDPERVPPSYRYFIDMVDRLKKVRPEDLTANSVLIGNSAQITETLKKVDAAGFDEVILYFNVGLKPHAQVKEEMDRFMAEVARAFR